MGKTRVRVHSFPTLHTLSTKPSTLTKLSTALLTALLITPLFLHLSPCYYLYTLHDNTNDLERLKQHTQQHNTHKQYNNTITRKRTCYSHHYSPTTLTTYKTMNQLSKCPLHLKYIIIKQYNITALNQTIQPLRAIKKALYTSVYNALLIQSFIY